MTLPRPSAALVRPLSTIACAAATFRDAVHMLQIGCHVSAATSTSPSAQGCIVIADDDDDVRNLLADRFEKLGYEVFTACDGVEMIELLEQVGTPAAIFIDLLMPGIVGGSVLDFIRSEPRLASVRTAIVTGSAELAPADAVVFRKPVPFEVLLAFARGCEPPPRAFPTQLARERLK